VAHAAIDGAHSGRRVGKTSVMGLILTGMETKVFVMAVSFVDFAIRVGSRAWTRVPRLGARYPWWGSFVGLHPMQSATDRCQCGLWVRKNEESVVSYRVQHHIGYDGRFKPA
jgi:hypothetical protein